VADDADEVAVDGVLLDRVIQTGQLLHIDHGVGLFVAAMFVRIFEDFVERGYFYWVDVVAFCCFGLGLFYLLAGQGVVLLALDDVS